MRDRQLAVAPRSLTLSEDEARHVRRGDRLPFDAGAVRGTAEVFAIAPGGDPVSHRVALRARVLDEPKGSAAARSLASSSRRRRRPGSCPSRRARSSSRETSPAPSCLRRGRARLRWLAVGESEGDRITIRAGLKPGEPVVDAPGALADGPAVEVRDAR